MERRKLGSFLVPLVSDLSFGFCPGISGDLPVFQMVAVSLAAEDEEGLDSTAAEKKVAVNREDVRVLLLMDGLDEEVCCSFVFDWVAVMLTSDDRNGFICRIVFCSGGSGLIENPEH